MEHAKAALLSLQDEVFGPVLMELAEEVDAEKCDRNPLVSGSTI